MSLNHALSIRSDFSIGESSLQIAKVVEQAKEQGYASVALVDTMTVSGLPDLFNAAKKAGIKPILGCTLRVYDDPLWRKPKKGEDGPKSNPWHSLKVYVRTEAGLKQLYALLTLAHDEAHFYYNGRVGFEDVMSTLKPGDVDISTGDFFGLMGHTQFMERSQRLHAAFGAGFWVEVVPIDTPLFDTLNRRALEVCRVTEAQPLATYPVLYPKDGADSADVLRAITSGNKMSDPWLQVPYVRDFELTEPKRLVDRFKRLASSKRVASTAIFNAVVNVDRFAAQDFYVFEKKAPSLPKMAPDEFAQLVQECRKGWVERFDRQVLGHKPEPADLDAVYKPRLAYELGVIQKMGFSGYFLLVQEIVRWSKAADIMVGPGRGSVGGSLIAYLMGITDVDPIRFELLFERFINPSRVDLPDADLDFMSTRRHEVIEHIETLYGKENVAGISNYSTLGPSSAMREVSRVHELDPFDYAASKQVEKEHGVSLSLEESAASVPDIAKFRDRFPAIWKHAVSLEGAMRNLGRHAAGVVVAGEPVVTRGVVETRSGGQVVNWDKRTVEDHGLIKMDILGLSTLDILTLCKEYIKARHFKTVDFLSLPLDDEKVLAAFGRGETVGVFQYESHGMRKLLTELAVNSTLNFEDLVAVTALFRPGPLDAGLCDDYVAIRQGVKSQSVEHPNMESALKATFGVIIYQEQVMQICRDVAGFTMTESDNVRKAMGKKDKDAMAKWKDRFIQGAQSVSSMTEFQSGALWDKIEVFAGYAFNRSHSVEYAIISWWCMWAKVYYPAEFYAAAMSVVDDNDKLATLVMDAQRADIKVLPPDINASSGRIEIRGERELVAPFQAVKGISENTAAAIVHLRSLAPGGKFENKAQMEALVTANKMGAKCNSAHREKLDRVGAFHSTDGGLQPLHPDRLKDRLELMPGFTVEVVKADRKIMVDTHVQQRMIRLVEDARVCQMCSLKGGIHVDPRTGRTPKFMVVFDSPTWQEERAGKMLEGDAAGYLKAALKDAGLSPNDGHYTALVRVVRPKTQKVLTTEQINGCSEYLRQEIELLKPPVIVAMGAAAIKFFAPSTKGNSSDLVGKVVFDPKLDASIVFGLNPGQVFHDPSKIALLQQVAARIADLVQ
jgi:DNA polymerase III subunit alpha